MRNTASTLYDEGDFTSNPLSTHKSLALEISQESAALSNDLHSLHLKSLIDDYLEPSSHSSNSSPQSPSYPFNPNPYHEDHKSLTHELQIILQSVGETYGELRKEVIRAIRKGDNLLSSYEQLHVLVLEHLKKLGFNAGICKSQRDPNKTSHQVNFPAEEYEYMDVMLLVEEKGIQGHASERVIIDLRFRSQFEIARPSTAYVDLLKVVPIVYVGTPRVLQKIIRSLSEAIKRSLKSQGMPLPPWRRLSYLHSKWLSSNYCRSKFSPPLTNLNCIFKNPSTKRENSPCSTPSSFNIKSESSHSIIVVNPPCVVTKPPPLVDSKHKLSSLFTTKRENSHSIINNPPPLVAKPPLHVDSKRILKSCNSTTHILPYNSINLRNSPNKESNIRSGEPTKVPWQVPLLSNPSSSLKRSKRLVGALTIALHYGSDSSTYLSSLEV